MLELREHYRVKRGPLMTNFVSAWRLDSGERAVIKEYLWDRRRDLAGITITNVVENSFPAETFEIDEGTYAVYKE